MKIETSDNEMHRAGKAAAQRETGVEIVRGLTRDRHWWQLTARDVEPWITTLHPSAVQDGIRLLDGIGDPWDGMSDIKVGTASVAAAKVSEILEGLQRRIAQRGIEGVAPPTSLNVRQQSSHSVERDMLTIDIDLGTFVLPIGIDSWMINDPLLGTADEIVDQMIVIVERAAGPLKGVIERRELRMRKALEETTARIGDGVAPLWLRMLPLPITWDAKYIPSSYYLMVIVTLDRCLEWSPVGTDRAHTCKDIRTTTATTAASNGDGPKPSRIYRRPNRGVG